MEPGRNRGLGEGCSINGMDALVAVRTTGTSTHPRHGRAGTMDAEPL